MVIRSEPSSLGATILIPFGITTNTERRLFSAGLALEDGDGVFRPYLAEALPQLNTDTWKVNADGTMETTYHLKPNLTWQDGQPLTADDFVFAHQVYVTPDYGTAGQLPHTAMSEVTAPDPRTVVIRWSKPYPRAAELFHELFAPLPRHLVEPAFARDRANLPSDAFWTTGFVAAGPFRVDRWESGSFIDAVAFDGHVLGRPKIDRLHITWNADFNATLANFLAGEADVPGDDSIRVDQGLILEREWNARNAGTVQYRPQLPRLIQVQHRAEYANPQAVRDVRVRQALASGIDKNAINESVFSGKAIVSDTLIYPTLSAYAVVDRAAAKYPYDTRRAEQLLTDAGLTKDSSGFFTDASGSRLNLEVRNIQSAQNDAERSIIADGWRRLGLEISEDVFTPVQTSSGETLGTFRALSITSASATPEGVKVDDYIQAAISRPDNRWFGLNRGGWANPEYDRLAAGYLGTLDPNERQQQLAQAVKILTTDLGFIPLEFNPSVVAYATGLQGVNVKAGDVDPTWNIYEWNWK
ncbi:MAG: peptide/nickel transport system substrate-binding protein [Chloroflexota bacterium]|jgi:peptide/nickel transport system substrate-binding protein|nr:peptide/nickel transport system substrate-binding protein [Chloroflexota bacterium]